MTRVFDLQLERGMLVTTAYQQHSLVLLVLKLVFEQ